MTTDDLDRCGPGIRGVAVAIDSFVWFALLFVAVFPVAAITGDVSASGGSTNADLDGAPAALALALWLALGVGYHALLEWQYGRTLGKYLVRIRAASADGSALSLREAVVRNTLRLVDWLPLFYGVGIVAVFASDRAQRLGDRVAGTVVVRN